MEYIKFSKLTSALGRNGNMKVSGLVIYDTTDGIHIAPLTSKGRTGVCYIGICKENAKDVIRAIQRICE